MSENKTVIVLGGGVGGLVAANILRSKLKKTHRVILIDRERDHLFAPSLLWLMTGLRTAAKISRPLARLKKKGIEVIHGEIESIDPTQKTVTVNGEKLHGDFLIVSLGAAMVPEAIPGLAEAGHNLYTLDGAEDIRDAINELQSGKIALLTAAPAYKCPAAPYEAAMLLEYHCRKRKIRDQVEIDLYTAEPGPMWIAGAEVTAAVRGMVEAKGVGYHPTHQVEKVDPARKQIVFTNGTKANFDLLVYVPPHRVPEVISGAGLAEDGGWVPVDRHTLETRFKGVFAIGDVNGIPLKVGKPLPMAGVFAHGQAEVVANNIAVAIKGKGSTATFDGHGDCFIEAGDGKAGLGRGNFYAEPTPTMKLYNLGRHWHAAKVAYEKYWLRRWF